MGNNTMGLQQQQYQQQQQQRQISYDQHGMPAGHGRVPMSVAVKGVLPFITVYILLLALFIAVPEIILVPMNFLIG